MKKFLFFAYRDWAINIFKDIVNTEDDYILITNKDLCTPEFIDSINPDIIFLYGWSWYVVPEITNKYLCMCLHPSPLPKYRGGSPIQNQIMNDELESAVTIFHMGEGLDDGPIYYQESFSLDGYLPEIFQRIESIGSWGTKLIILKYKNNMLVSFDQDEAKATSYKRLKPSNSEIKPIDFLNNSALYFYNKIRGLQKPYPEAYIRCKSGKLIFEKVRYEKDIQNISDFTTL